MRSCLELVLASGKLREGILSTKRSDAFALEGESLVIIDKSYPLTSQ